MPNITPNVLINGSLDKHVAFERLKAKLVAAFAVPDDAYVTLTAREVIARNRARRMS